MNVARTLRGGAFCVATCLVILPAIAQANSPPVVTNVSSQQIAGTGNVRVTYDVSDADGDSVTASVIFSSNNGVSFDLYAVSVTGDVNKPMAPGPGKQIIWNAAADYPGRYWQQVVAKVAVSDGPTSSEPMVFVPAGPFVMGSSIAGYNGSGENYSHTVTLDAFYIDQFEVTNADFKRFIDAGGYSTQAFWSAAGWAWSQGYAITAPAYWSTGQYHSGPGWPGFPVVGVSWYEAEAYARFVGRRLPTEAEWEKSARGTDERDYPWGSGLDGSRANCYGSGDPYEAGSSPVGYFNGSLQPNPPFQTSTGAGPYGAYDQAGNAAEWVQDWYSASYYQSSPSANPQGPTTGQAKVVRGGAWSVSGQTDGQRDVRVWHRIVEMTAPEGWVTSVIVPTTRDAGLGFRCARSAP